MVSQENVAAKSIIEGRIPQLIPLQWKLIQWLQHCRFHYKLHMKHSQPTFSCLHQHSDHFATTVGSVSMQKQGTVLEISLHSPEAAEDQLCSSGICSDLINSKWL